MKFYLLDAMAVYNNPIKVKPVADSIYDLENKINADTIDIENCFIYSERTLDAALFLIAGRRSRYHYKG
jgi:hypothetical protein